MDNIEVSVIIPVKNEIRYIKKCIDSVLNQDFPKSNMEIILADGMSDDGTRDIIAGYENEYNFIRMIDNPKGTISCGLNLAIKAAKGEYIVRLDAHADYAPDYVSKCIYYHKNTDAANIGGPTVVKGQNPVQKAVAAAYYSPFALGGGKQHIDGYCGESDTVRNCRF